MKALITTSILTLALLSGTARASNVFDDIRNSAPHSGRVFSDLQNTAPRSVYDDIRDTAPRSIFDQIRDTAPRSDGVFGSLQNSAP